MSKALGIDDYGLQDLLETAQRAKRKTWRLRKHPTRDAMTVYGQHGYIVHPDLGYFNDEADAAFVATFDPAMVLSILERLAELTPAPALPVSGEGDR